MATATQPVNDVAPAVLSAHSGVCATCGRPGIESSEEAGERVLQCPYESCGATFRCPPGDFSETYLNDIAKAGGGDELFIKTARIDQLLVKTWLSPDFVLTDSEFVDKYELITRLAVGRLRFLRKLHAHGWLSLAPHPRIGPPDSPN